jgi:hypothetical protein
MRTTRRQVRFARILGFILLPVAFVAVLVDINQMSERTTAEREAEARGLPCMALSDPTVGVYPLTKELNLLAQADPEAVAYFHTAGVTVTQLDGATSNRCFGRVNSNNPVGTKIIFLNTYRLTTPESRAVALSHELVHVEHGDPIFSTSRHSFLRRLWRTEEGEAHLRGLQTARRLHTKLMYPAWEDYVAWIYLLPISYGIFALTAVLIIYEAHRKHQHRQQLRAFTSAQVLH